MLMSILMFLLYVVLIAIVVYAVIFVLGQIGVQIPPKIIQLIWLAVLIIVLIWFVGTILPGIVQLPKMGMLRLLTRFV